MARDYVMAQAPASRPPHLDRLMDSMQPTQPDSPAERIRAQLEQVARLRAQAEGENAAGAEAVRTVQRLQARRFTATYADMSADPRFAAATRFFLEELYGDRDFRERDAQFARIAGAIERLFPAQVAQLAVDMAQLHALTETLDARLATHWQDAPQAEPAQRYVWAWRQTGERAQRERQLAVVLHMGRELQRLTAMKSLRLGLRMMRGPAQAAGLGALQTFLESGFDAFGQMVPQAGRFVDAIAERGAGWIATLFDANDAEPRLAALLAKA